MNPWRDCKKDPSEEGKKVLCEHEGDLFVAVRIKKYYVPFPFAEHFFSKRLSNARFWQEIEFPEWLTGRFFLSANSGATLLTLEEMKINDKKVYDDFCSGIISILGDQQSYDDMRSRF